MFQGRDRVGVTILTGFLGAGKSTLLNRILKDPAMRDCAVIINEFGEVGIDHLLVETSGDSLVELSNGCLCCTVRGALIDTLADLMDGMQTGRIKPVSRVVIETTGLADPAPVMQSVIGNPVIASNYDLEGVVTVVDGVNGLDTLARFPEALKQVAVADRIVLSKLSLIKDAAALRTKIAALNPRAPVADADGPPASLLANGLYDPTTKIADVARWLKDESLSEGHDHHQHHHGHQAEHGHHHHDRHHGHGQAGHEADHVRHENHGHDPNRHGEHIRAQSILHDAPIAPAAFEMFIDLMRSAHGPKLLRMKGIVALTDDPSRPVVIHGVQSVFHPPVRLKAWPDPSDRRTRLVMITEDLDAAFVQDLFDAFVGKPRVDRPDSAALGNNPLAVPGMRF